MVPPVGQMGFAERLGELINLTSLVVVAGQLKIGRRLAGVLEGIRFPVANGYVFLRRGGGYGGAMTGQRVVREAGALIGIGSAAGISFTVWFQQAPQSSTSGVRAPAR